MFNNVYENIKKFIKKNYKSLIFYIVLCIVFLCPLNYYIIVMEFIPLVISKKPFISMFCIGLKSI